MKITIIQRDGEDFVDVIIVSEKGEKLCVRKKYKELIRQALSTTDLAKILGSRNGGAQ